jgi:pantoate kinase
MNKDRLRAVGPWKESLTEREQTSASSQTVPEGTGLSRSASDPIFALVAEALEASAKAMEELAHVLRSDARRVRKLG